MVIPDFKFKFNKSWTLEIWLGLDAFQENFFKTPWAMLLPNTSQSNILENRFSYSTEKKTHRTRAWEKRNQGGIFM